MVCGPKYIRKFSATWPFKNLSVWFAIRRSVPRNRVQVPSVLVQKIGPMHPTSLGVHGPNQLGPSPLMSHHSVRYPKFMPLCYLALIFILHAFLILEEISWSKLFVTTQAAPFQLIKISWSKPFITAQAAPCSTYQDQLEQPYSSYAQAAPETFILAQLEPVKLPKLKLHPLPR